MLLKFSVTNYRSIGETVTLSLIAGRERKNAQRLSSVKALRKRVLPLVMIQGKNGAGKTNIIKALVAASRTISKTRQPNEKLDVVPFRLCNQCLNEPTMFVIEFVIKEVVYQYLFSLTRETIQSESLLVLKHNSIDALFTRNGQEINSSGLTGNEDEKNDLRIIAQSTQPNQLFLNTLALQAENAQGYSWASTIRHVFDWLTKGIHVLSPDMNIAFDDEDQIAFLSETIPLFDTGINSVNLVELSKDVIDFPQNFIQSIINAIPEGSVLPFVHPHLGHIFIRKINGEAKLSEVKTTHKTDSGESVPFHLIDESDGTFRLMSLLTLLSSLGDQNRNRVIVIDEIDRSLHTSVTRKIIKDFLAWVEKTHTGQLIFTSLDPSLMNSELGLRRDEMWIADKSPNGETKLHSLASLNVQSSGEKGLRTGMNLTDEFLSGKLGGIAKTQEMNFLENR